MKEKETYHIKAFNSLGSLSIEMKAATEADATSKMDRFLTLCDELEILNIKSVDETVPAGATIN